MKCLLKKSTKLEFINNTKGFTLIELIVVLAVLAIITLIAIPKFMGVQQSAKKDADYSTGAMVASSIELYYAQNGGINKDSNIVGGPISELKGSTTGSGIEAYIDLDKIKIQSDDLINGSGGADIVYYNVKNGSIIIRVGSNDGTIIYPKP